VSGQKCSTKNNQGLKYKRYQLSRVELLPGFKFTGKMVKTIKFTGKIGKNGKKW
jgi:hypothetical protein